MMILNRIKLAVDRVIAAFSVAVMVALELCQELMQANRAVQSQAACQRLVQDMIAQVKQAVAQNQG